jgi:two-component system LytT family response regulator
MIRSVIVDDESKGIEVLKLLLKYHCPEVEIMGQAEEINEAVDLIKDKQPDLIFLDIEISDGTCFEILEQVKAYNFHLVLVTAHSEYAVKAFRYSVIDYLLKPVDIIELKEAVGKVKTLMAEKRNSSRIESEMTAAKLTIRVPHQHGAVFIKMLDIIRLEAEGAYTRIITDKREYLVSHNIKMFETILDMNFFARVHRSHIINVAKVRKIIDGKIVLAELTDDSRIEISRRMKNTFFKHLILM